MLHQGLAYKSPVFTWGELASSLGKSLGFTWEQLGPDLVTAKGLPGNMLASGLLSAFDPNRCNALNPISLNDQIYLPGAPPCFLPSHKLLESQEELEQ